MKEELKNYVPIKIEDSLLTNLQSEMTEKGFESLSQMVRYILRQYFRGKDIKDDSK